MTYSNSYNSEETSATNEEQTTPTTESTQLNSESEFEANEEFAIAEMEVDMDQIQEDLTCLQPYISQLTRPAVKEYDFDYVNDDAPQFEECPDTNYAYRQGWNYVDFDPDEDFHGNITSNVLTIRAVPCGAPTTMMGGELYNPGRLQRLPNQAVSYETMEPKRFLWVHPWLEKGESSEDIISNQIGETSISLYHSYKSWQSGPVQNGPADEEANYEAGLETMPGGEDSRLSNKPTNVLWKTSKGNKRWIYSIGNSRGKEDLAGYKDQKTEGLEYGAVGVHGWMSSVYNNGVKTKSNAGLKFLYLMGRLCTSGDEIQANIEAFVLWIDSINQGFSATIPSFEYETPPEIHDIKNWKSDRQGLGISDGDKPKLISLIKYFQKLVDDVQKLVSESEDDDWDFGECVNKGVFDVTDNRFIENNEANKTFIDILCELVSEKSWVNEGKKKSEYEYPIAGSVFINRLERSKLTHTDFLNFFFTRKIIANHKLAQQLHFDFDIKKMGLYENGAIDESEIEQERFVLDALIQGNVKNFTYRDNILGVEYNDGFVSNLNYFRNKTDGFCEACERYGGQITADGNKIYCYDSVKEEIIKTYTGDVIIHNPWTIEEDNIVLHRSEALYDEVYVPDPDAYVNSRKVDYGNFQDIPENTLAPEEGQYKVQYLKRPTEKRYNKWRGLWCCPTYDSAAPPPWAMYRKNKGNKIHTYGPLTEEEADKIFYMFAGPKNASQKVPPQDYGFTVWWAEKHNAPDTEWGQNTKIYPPEANMGAGGASGKNKGWSQFGLGPIRAYGAGGAKIKKLYFRVAFWQWVGGRGNKAKGPPIKSTHFPPSDPAYPGHVPDALSPQGVWMDCIMQPATPYSPYEDPENFPNEEDTTPVGPSYGTQEIDINELSGSYYSRDLNTENLTKNRWHEILPLESTLLHPDIKDKKVPLQTLFFVKDSNAIKDTNLDENDFQAATIIPPNTKRYVYGDYEKAIFLATDSDRTQSEWSKDGETWLKLKEVRASTIKIGPGYWGKPTHNMWDEYFQAPLNAWDPNSYNMDPRNKFIVAGKRYKISPIHTADFQTTNDYEVVFCKYREALNPYTYDGGEDYEDLFISVGQLRANQTGFSFVAPSNVMLFGAYNTIKRKTDWSVMGEEVQILIEEEVGVNDNESGPAYWAFGNSRNSLGSQGYVDFWDNYWFKPFNHYNKFVGNADKIKKGTTYKMSLPASAQYAYRVIWAKSEDSLDTSWQKETKVLNGITNRNYPFIYSEDVIYPGEDPVEVEALSDYMVLGAMRIDNAVEIGGAKTDWSIKGMPLLVDFNVEEYDPDAEIEHGPSYWMNANKDMFNDTLYYQPLNSVTDNDFVDPNVDGLVKRMVRGEKYKIRTTGNTPAGYEYVGIWIDKNGVTYEYEKDDEITLKAGDTNWVYFRAKTEQLCFGAFVNGGRTEDSWSPDGEPMFVEVMEDDRPPVGIQGTQYWNDVGGPEEDRHYVLKNSHWNEPIKQTKFQNENTLKPNTSYEITIVDDTQNPDYTYKVWLGEYPNSLNPNVSSTYLSGPKLKRGETKTFKTDDVNVTLIIGAFDTQRDLISWSPDGEPVYINLEELPPVDEDDEFERGSVYYGDGVNDNISPLEDKFGYFNPERTFTAAEDADKVGERHTRAINPVGTGYDNHPQIKRGSRYRITPVMPNGTDPYPGYHTDTLPYNTRMWWATRPNALDPALSEFTDWTAGRAIISKVQYVDVVAPEDGLVFGAFHLPRSGNEVDPENLPRQFYEWSPFGEPTHYTIEELPEVPKSGPLYHQSAKNNLPSIADEHFYGPINTLSVVAERTYQIEKNEKYQNGRVEYQIWYMKDYDNFSHQNSDYRSQNGINIPIDPRHPEDLFVPGTIGVVDDNDFYLKGPVLDKNTSSQLFTPPKGYSRIFLGEISSRSIADFSRDGDPFDMGPDSINAGGSHPEFPDPNIPGQPGTGIPPISIGEFVPDPSVNGPTYWGMNELISGPSFDNSHFEDPLNYVAVEGGRTYEVEKSASDSLDLYNVSIYSFDRNIIPSPLIPKNNKNKVKQRFTKIGEFNKTSTRVRVDIPEDHNSVIYSAKNIVSPHPSDAGGIEAWSIFGEPERVVLKPVAEFKGPVLWADSNSLSEVYEKGFPKFDMVDKWSEKFYPKVVNTNTDYVLRLTEVLDYEITVFMYKDNRANKASTAQKQYYTKVLTIPKNTPLNKEFYVNSGPNMHVMYGASNITNRYNKPEIETELEFWSPKGIPAPITWAIRKWHSGPAYPAHDQEGGKWRPDWTNSRWKTPFPAPMTPQGENKFTKGKQYEFKITSKLEYNYQLWWSNYKTPYSSNTSHGGSLIISANGRKFNKRAEGNYAYFAIVNKTGAGNNLPPVSEWSPKGTPAPFRAKKNQVDKPDNPKPKPWWYYLIMALLLALLITWMIYASAAPLDVLIEMNEEMDHNQYPIRRWKVKTDEDGEEIGYNYPDPTPIDSKAWMNGLDSRPVYFNYVADVMVRAWARLMRIRHNGYMIHGTSMASTNSSSDWHKKHRLEFFNMTPNYSVGYLRMYNSKMSKVLRYYDPDFPDEERKRNIDRFNPYNGRGVQYVIPDTRKSKTRNSRDWRDEYKWFEPSLSYCHTTANNATVKTMGDVAYKLGDTLKTNHDKRVYPSGNIDGSPGPTINNIFTRQGSGFTINHSYSGDTSSHAYHWEICNADMTHKWPNLELSALIFPKIEFDVIPVTGSSAEWQFVRFDLNLYEFDDVTNTSIKKRTAVKLEPVGGSYVMRDTFESGKPSTHKLGQISSNTEHFVMASPVPIIQNQCFASLSMAVWIGGGGKKHIRIGNLRAFGSYEPYN